MQDPLVITRRLAIPAAELTERFSRSAGPGGQGVNTTDSRVELVFDVAGSPCVPDELRERLLARLARRLVEGRLAVVAGDERRQLANRRSARHRLARLLREAAAPPARTRRTTKPTAGSVERRLSGKRHRARIKRGRGGAAVRTDD